MSTMPAVKRGGRPHADRIYVGIRLPRELHPLVKQAAADEDRSLSSWLLNLCRQALRKREEVSAQN
jgi:hypothetical protein